MSSETTGRTPSVSLEEYKERFRELFKTWDGFYEASTPVAQADSLLRFSNEFYHLRTALEEEWGPISVADGHDLEKGDKVRFYLTFGKDESGQEYIGTVISDIQCFVSVIDDESGLADGVDLDDIVKVETTSGAGRYNIHQLSSGDQVTFTHHGVGGSRVLSGVVDSGVDCFVVIEYGKEPGQNESINLKDISAVLERATID